ncbi:MAG: hypothetical protein V3T19_00830 [Acidiferrobacterales bacterium]
MIHGPKENITRVAWIRNGISVVPVVGSVDRKPHPDFSVACLALAKAYKISYQLNPRSSSTQTLIDHSGDMMVKDAQGKLRLLIKNHASVEDMEHDIKLLLKEKSRS